MHQGLLLLKTTDIIQEITRRYLKSEYDTIGYIIKENDKTLVKIKSIFDYHENTTLQRLDLVDLTKHSTVEMMYIYPMNNITIVKETIDALKVLDVKEALYNVVNFVSPIKNIKIDHINPVILVNDTNVQQVEKDKLFNVASQFLHILLTNPHFKHRLFKDQKEYEYGSWLENIIDAYKNDHIPVIAVNDLIKLVNQVKNCNYPYLVDRDYRYAVIVSNIDEETLSVDNLTINIHQPNLSSLSVEDLYKLRHVLNSSELYDISKYSNIKQHIDEMIIKKHN